MRRIDWRAKPPWTGGSGDRVAAMPAMTEGQQVGAASHTLLKMVSMSTGTGDPARGPAMAFLPVPALSLTGLEKPLAQPAGGKP